MAPEEKKPSDDKKWKSGYAGEKYNMERKAKQTDKPQQARKESITTATAAGDAPVDKKKQAAGKDDKGKGKKGEPPDDKSLKGKKSEPLPQPESEEVEVDPAILAQEEAEQRAEMRRRQLRKRQWPEVTKVKITTKPWHPPGPPEKCPRVVIEYPPLELKKWVSPIFRRRNRRQKLPRIPPEEITQMLPYKSTLKKVWHNFGQVGPNKMMLQGSIGCNSKKYMPHAAGAQTGCIALVARALLDEKPPAKMTKRDVDDVIEAGDRFYRQCLLAMKCYKGKPQLELNQLLPWFYFHDTKYTVKMKEGDSGQLAKSPDDTKAGADMMALMEKRAGTGNFVTILTLNGDQHFLVWGGPEEGAGGTKNICYLFDPHLLNEYGEPDTMARGAAGCCGVYGGAGVLRYPSIQHLVVDFLGSYAQPDPKGKGPRKVDIGVTEIEIAQKEPLIREPDYSLEMKLIDPKNKDEWIQYNTQQLYEKKKKSNKYNLASLSGISLAASRKSSRKKVIDLIYPGLMGDDEDGEGGAGAGGAASGFGGDGKEPVPPVPPEKPPPVMTKEDLKNMVGEDFFLNCPNPNDMLFGRDDVILTLPPSGAALHSPADVADLTFTSQYVPIGYGKAMLRGTRHFASYRYQVFKDYAGPACVVAALAMLHRYKARGWNEDILDETLDYGFNLFRETLMERRGPIRRLVLGELNREFPLREMMYKHKEKGIVVWGKIASQNPNVFDLCRGIESFFREADAGLLQIPGEYEVGLWNEGGCYYLYHPWPADRYGLRVGLQDGGKACLMRFFTVEGLCDHLFENVKDMKRKPYSISAIDVYELEPRPESLNNMKAVGPNRWVMKGTIHEGDERFREENRGKQATASAIAAIAQASVIDPDEWTKQDLDECLIRGDQLYEKTMDNLDKMGINLETPARIHEEGEGEAEGEEVSAGTTGQLAAADVLPRFKISDYDCIETDIIDSAYSGQLAAEKNSGVMNLKDSLRSLFKDNKAGVLTTRGASMAVFKKNDNYYFFDPHACSDNGLPSDDNRAGAAMFRVKDIGSLTEVIMGNLPPGTDDSFNLSPVDIYPAKLNVEIGAPEVKLENKAFEWLNKRAAAILMGPRGENTAIGKAAYKAKIPEDDLAGRTLALPAAAAFCAAAEAVPPPYMHQDHLFNFLEAGGEFYENHVKKTGRKDITTDDLNERFEMGVNTFAVELGESTRLPLRLPDHVGEAGGEEEGPGGGYYEGEEIPVDDKMKQMKDLLFKHWYDVTKQNQIYMLVGDYHQLGIWMAPEGKVVAFDPAPTLTKGLLTPQRIKKGDQLRLQRIKDETVTEEGADDEEMEGEGGEEKPEPEPEFVPPESCPALMIFSSPGELIDRLVEKAPLDNKQMIAPYWLYPVTVTNELTSVLKDKKGKESGPKGEGDETEENAEEDTPLETLDDSALGKHFTKMNRTVASLRGKVAQNENYFLEDPNRDNQDAANAIMGIVVNTIEPYQHWKPALIDAILKYGDRLYTYSLPRAAKPPRLAAHEVLREWHVTHFDVDVDIAQDVVTGDVKAGEGPGPTSLRKGLKKFFQDNSQGVICAKDYCVAIWRAADGKSYVYWDPHTIGPTGKYSPSGSAGVVVFANLDDLADTYKASLEDLERSGTNKFTICAVEAKWDLSDMSPNAEDDDGGGLGVGGVPDDQYEYKVLTAYSAFGKGKTMLRGSRPQDATQFFRDSLLQSAATAIVAAVMSRVRRPHLWTRRIIDEIMSTGQTLFSASVGTLGYEFRPGEDVLMPLQVQKRFILGVNYVRYDLDTAYSGRLESKTHSKGSDINVKAALEHFFSRYTHGVLWCPPHAVAVWRVAGAPSYYMMEPHPCGPTGLRTSMQEDGQACVMTFASPKTMADVYLNNIPKEERPKHEYVLYVMSIVVSPIRSLKKEPPLVQALPGQEGVVPATSKVTVDGRKRRADESKRKHPPGTIMCFDAQKWVDERDKHETKFKGQRNSNGWLVLNDCTQYLSAGHSMNCKRYPYASRGKQALSCSVMAVAMSRVEDVCRWCTTTLDQILDSGDQLYQDSYLHYRPENTQLLTIEQVLRKFYTPGNCVVRVVVYKARQTGTVGPDLVDKLTQFFREEKAGVFVAGEDFAVALFKTPRGFYMFDPDDRDRYGRAVPPPCSGKARACFSQYPTVKSLAEKLGANIPPVFMPVNVERPQHVPPTPEPSTPATKGSPTRPPTTTPRTSQVGFHVEQMVEQPANYAIYGMSVSSLRRLNQHEK